MLLYAFKALKLPQVKAGVDVSNDTPNQTNLASLRVIEKLGMKFLENRQIQENFVAYYVLTAEDYPLKLCW
ncbi:MAG: hypothetical protein Fur0046_05250 [Cyanobacteria bacterium J069]